jgi:hypothetical protein
MCKTHPLAVTVGLVETVVGAILVSLRIVAEDFAGVEEQAVDFEGLGQVVDQVDRLLLHHVLLGSLFQNCTGFGGKERGVNGAHLALVADEEEEDVGLQAEGRSIEVFDKGDMGEALLRSEGTGGANARSDSDFAVFSGRVVFITLDLSGFFKSRVAAVAIPGHINLLTDLTHAAARVPGSDANSVVEAARDLVHILDCMWLLCVEAVEDVSVGVLVSKA